MRLRPAATTQTRPTRSATRDTIDADGDGIYCEALPCPCSKGGGGGEATPPVVNKGPSEAQNRAKAKARARARARRRARLREARQRREIEQGETVVVEVADGDTLRVQKTATGKVLRVRLIGIDTPETRDPGTPVQCGGPEATSNMLALTFPAPLDTNADGLLDQEGTPVGATVRLKTDRTQAVYDRFKRALAYVNVLGGGQPGRPPGYDVGLEQIRAGWAMSYVFDTDFARLTSYSGTESEASNLSAGVWGRCGGNFHTRRHEQARPARRVPQGGAGVRRSPARIGVRLARGKLGLLLLVAVTIALTAVIGREYVFAVARASEATTEPVLPAHVTSGRSSETDRRSWPWTTSRQ